jgi:hypothetical protein
MALVLLTAANPSSRRSNSVHVRLGRRYGPDGINLTVSNSSGRKRGEALSWLNFFWSLGATICPVLAAAFLARQRLVAFHALLFLSVGIETALGGASLSN